MFCSLERRGYEAGMQMPYHNFRAPIIAHYGRWGSSLGMKIMCLFMVMHRTHSPENVVPRITDSVCIIVLSHFSVQVRRLIEPV